DAGCDLRGIARLSHAGRRNGAGDGPRQAPGVSLVADRPQLSPVAPMAPAPVGQPAALRERADEVCARRGRRLLRADGMARGGVPPDPRRRDAPAPRAEDGMAVEGSGTARVEATTRAVQEIFRSRAARAILTARLEFPPHARLHLPRITQTAANRAIEVEQQAAG